MRKLSAILVGLLAVSTMQIASGDSHYQVMTDVRLEMDDGVTMTADVYVPTVADGDDADALYPCVVELTPYRKEGRAAEGRSYLPGAGIALIEVDARGTGGSEGEYDIVFSVREQADTAAWVEWAAAQATKPDDTKLCESTVGLYGGSYSGIIQYLVASLPVAGDPDADPDLPTFPPSLAAIAPQRAYGDLYRDIVYHGGQVIGSFGTIWSGGTTAFYTQPPTDIAQPSGQAAWLDHLTKNDPMILPYVANQYADARYTSDDSTPAYSQDLYADSSVLPRIEDLRVPTLHLAGFYDTFTRGQLLTFQRAHELEQQHGDRGPNFLIAGPWTHSSTHFITPDQGFKQHLGEWYRYWLEGEAEGAAPPAWIADGFDGRGARVRYFQHRSTTVNPAASAAASHGTWETSATWPPPVSVKHLWLRGGGRLLPEPADDLEGAGGLALNPTSGTGEILSRWDNAAYGGAYARWDQRTEDGKGLTYLTDVLDEDLEIAGPISATLTMQTFGQDGDPSLADGWPGEAQLTPPYLDADLVLKISDVAPDGTAMLVTQGYLRMSHRAYDAERSVYIDGQLMAPYHLHTLAALDPPVSSDLREYVVEVWPTAKTFPAGHRLRLDIYTADTPNHLNLLTDSSHFVWQGFESFLSVPVRR